MNFDEINKKAWKDEINKNIMLYPDERVVSFLGRNYRDLKNNENKNAIDIGFGSGRHLKLLMDYNFNTYGIDYNQRCVDIANELFGENKKLKKLSTIDIKELTSIDNYFDVVIVYGVIFLRKIEDIKKDLIKIKQIMKDGAKLFLNFRTKEDINFGKGKKIDNNTYLLDESSREYENMVYSFLDIEEVRELFLEIGLNIEREERLDYYKSSLEQKHSWWIITAKK